LWRQPLRLVAAALLVNTACYGFLFWGMGFVSSGLSAVVNLALIPVGLFGLGVLLRQETFSRRQAAALLIGASGLYLLFRPRLAFAGNIDEFHGLAAIVAGTLAYCLGSLLARPVLEGARPLAVAGLLTFIGGLGLLVLAVAFEPLTELTAADFLTLPVLASWLFLVLGGSLAAFTIYLKLLRDWGPSQAGLYTFVSPLIAVAVGMAVFDEAFGPSEAMASAVMLGAVALARANPIRCFRWRPGGVESTGHERL
jgi:drug/metabolite transporter (DMT)-like permease